MLDNTTKMTYQKLLESVGLSPNEAKIYETLLERGESSVSDIAVAAKVHRRNAYDAIERLINKGLCFQIFSTKENTYNAVDPGKLLEFVSEQKEELEKALPELKKKFGARYAPEEAYIYRGLEGQKNIWRDMLRVGADSYVVGAKGGWFDPRLESYRIAFFKEANRKKLKFFQLFDYEMKIQRPTFTRDWPGNLKFRYLSKEYSTNSLLHVFGDYVVTYSGLEIDKINEDTNFFIMHSKDLAESYRKWFWYMWGKSTEEKKK